MDNPPRMLKSLQISRFKSVKEQRLEFGRVNLFIGGNGTGKSNLLEAVGLASACLSRGLSDSDIAAKGMRLTPAELMKSSFKNDLLPKTLELDASFEGGINYKCSLSSREGDPYLKFFSESSTIDGIPVFGRSYRGAKVGGISLTHVDRLEPHRGIWDQIKTTTDTKGSVSDAFSEFGRYVIYTPQADFLRGRQAGRVDTPPIGLHGEGLPEAVSSFLDVWRAHVTNRNANEFDKSVVETCTNLVWLPGWAGKFGVRANAPPFGVHVATPTLTSRDVIDRASESVYFVDRFMHTSRNHLSVYDSSEGTLFLLFAGIILGHPQSPKIFALDNVDSALNPRLTRLLVENIIKVCKNQKNRNSTIGAKQVFLTSHNPTALDAFDIFDDDMRVYIVSRNAKGHTIASRLEPPPGMSRQQWDLSAGGRNLSQIWLDNLIPGALGSSGL